MRPQKRINFDCYKTQNGILKSISRNSDKGNMVGWNVENAIYTLKEKFGWEDNQARRYVNGYRNNIHIITEGFA